MNKKKSTVNAKSPKTVKQDKNKNLQMSKTEKLRSFLNKNRIFFETIAATTLTIMAIVVAVAQLITTNEQTAYLEQQTIIERSQALPRFTVQVKQFMNEEGTFAEDEKIMVYNHGNIAYNIKVDAVIFFELTYSENNKSRNLRIPISGYYAANIYTGDSTGLIVSSYDAKNHYKRFNLQNQLYDLEETTGRTISIDVKRYVKISYTDIFEVDHVEYYFVPIIYGGELLETAEGEKIFNEYDSEMGKMLDINDLTPEVLYSLFQ